MVGTDSTRFTWNWRLEWRCRGIWSGEIQFLGPGWLTLMSHENGDKISGTMCVTEYVCACDSDCSDADAQCYRCRPGDSVEGRAGFHLVQRAAVRPRRHEISLCFPQPVSNPVHT